MFTKKSFIYTFLEFTESYSGPLGDIESFVRLIPGTYKSEKPIGITSLDEINLKGDFIDGYIVDGVTQSILYSFALSSPPGH